MRMKLANAGINAAVRKERGVRFEEIVMDAVITARSSLRECVLCGSELQCLE